MIGGGAGSRASLRGTLGSALIVPFSENSKIRPSKSPIFATLSHRCLEPSIFPSTPTSPVPLRNHRLTLPHNGKPTNCRLDHLQFFQFNFPTRPNCSPKDLSSCAAPYCQNFYNDLTPNRHCPTKLDATMILPDHFHTRKYRQSSTRRVSDPPAKTSNTTIVM